MTDLAPAEPAEAPEALGGHVSGMLRGAMSILMRRRPADARPRGCDWQEDWKQERVLPAGTVLYKGTWDPEVTPGNPSSYTWYTTHRPLAQMFSTSFDEEDADHGDENPLPMIHEYVLDREIRLPLIRSEAEVNRFCRRYGIGGEYAAQTRGDALRSGLPGWVALGRYKKQCGGDDILIGDVGGLRYVRSFDAHGRDIGMFEPEGVQAMRR